MEDTPGDAAGGGHLLYYRAGSLLDVPFDPERLEVGSTSPVTIADDVLQDFGPIGALFAVSNTNTVAYAPAAGRTRQFERRLAWTDREGRTEPIAAPPRNYDYFTAFSVTTRMSFWSTRERSGASTWTS